jgi:hypothetical protein
MQELDKRRPHFLLLGCAVIANQNDLVTPALSRGPKVADRSRQHRCL